MPSQVSIRQLPEMQECTFTLGRLQGSLQAPQWFTSVSVLTSHPVPQLESQLPQGLTQKQLPPEQVAFWLQAKPQEPQLSVSLLRLTQSVPQQDSGAVQFGPLPPQRHAPEMQVSPASQPAQHAPQ